MNCPNIRYYALMEIVKGCKTPKYTITAQAGFYAPMEQLKGKDGKVSFYLMEKLKEGANVPSMRLQAKNSLNLTGLKEYFVDGKLSGYAYGYPSDKPTYSKKNRTNPFYEYKEDGYLLRLYQDEQSPQSYIPTKIELIVLENAKILISAYCKQLFMGGFDNVLSELREQADKCMTK